jgi:hypothetical protein
MAQAVGARAQRRIRTRPPLPAPLAHASSKAGAPLIPHLVAIRFLLRGWGCQRALRECVRAGIRVSGRRVVRKPVSKTQRALYEPLRASRGREHAKGSGQKPRLDPAPSWGSEPGRHAKMHQITRCCGCWGRQAGWAVRAASPLCALHRCARRRHCRLLPRPVRRQAWDRPPPMAWNPHARSDPRGTGRWECVLPPPKQRDVGCLRLLTCSGWPRRRGVGLLQQAGRQPVA